MQIHSFYFFPFLPFTGATRFVRCDGRFSAKSGGRRISHDLRLTWPDFSAIFLLGRAGEPVRPLCWRAKENCQLRDFGIYV